MNKTIDAFVVHIQTLLPKYRIVRKKDSTLMKILNVLLFFVPNFMAHFTTTIGSTVYLTDDLLEADSDLVIPILAHEAQHVYDKPYMLFYLFPQVLAVGALLSVLAIWFSNAWLWSLTLLALLAPLPAPGRMWIERRGYLASLACYNWLYSEAMAFSAINVVVKQFTSKNYFFMWPFKQSLKKWFTKNLTLVTENPEAVGPVYAHVRSFIKNRRDENGKN